MEDSWCQATLGLGRRVLPCQRIAERKHLLFGPRWTWWDVHWFPCLFRFYKIWRAASSAFGLVIILGLLLSLISCFQEEKLAALYMRSPISGMGIWVTTKTEPNKLLWSNFFKINLEAIPRTSRFRTRSFFIDEEKKRFFFS